MGRIRTAVISGLLLVASVSCMLFVAEAALRLTPFSRLLAYDGMPEGYYVLDRELGYDIARNFATSTHRFSDGEYDVWSNELGCFDMPFSASRPFVLLLGDSFAWGFAPFEAK